MSELYVLELLQGKFYIGTSANVEARFRAHLAGRGGSSWTALYRPIRILERRPVCTRFDEDNTVKLYMIRYGIENVRGGSYSSVQLDEVSRTALQREMRGASDTCFGCGGADHWASSCPHQQRDRPVTVTRETYSQTAGGGSRLGVRGRQRLAPGCSRTSSESDHDRCCFRCGRPGHWASDCHAQTSSESDHDDCCFRCGRPGHWASACYARSDVDGRRL